MCEEARKIGACGVPTSRLLRLADILLSQYTPEYDTR